MRCRTARASMGSICAAWVTDSSLPDYAKSLSGDRYTDSTLMAGLAVLGSGSL